MTDSSVTVPTTSKALSVKQAEERVMSEMARKQELADLQSALDPEFGALQEMFEEALKKVYADYSDLQQAATGVTKAQQRYYQLMFQLKGVEPGNVDALMHPVYCPQIVSEQDYLDLISQKEFQAQYAVELQAELEETQRQLKALQEQEPQVIEKIVEGGFEGKSASDWAKEVKDTKDYLAVSGASAEVLRRELREEVASQIRIIETLQKELEEAQRQLKALQEQEPQVIEKIVEGGFEGKSASDWAKEAKDTKEQLKQLLQQAEEEKDAAVPPSSDNQEVKEQPQIKFGESYETPTTDQTGESNEGQYVPSWFEDFRQELEKDAAVPPSSDNQEVKEQPQIKFGEPSYSSDEQQLPDQAAAVEVEPFFVEGKLLYTGKKEEAPLPVSADLLWEDLLQELRDVHQKGVLQVVDRLERLHLEPAHPRDAAAISEFLQCSKGLFEFEKKYWDRKEHLARKALEILNKPMAEG